ncbi:MAG: AAA family ATPase [Bacteroidales bacterium]|jgi:AAA15 family ATPase/GTPase|nr:AAA family ATPase [Bacteroidales bacterium]
MILKKIIISNYKSIDNLEIDFNGDNKGFFGFLGINEAGKSNLLKAISLKDNLSEFNYENSRRKEVDEEVRVIY